MKSSTEQKTEIITKDTSISEILEKFPEAKEILMEYGLMCVGCPFASRETLETGLKIHGFEHKLKMVFWDLNRVAGKGNSSFNHF